MIEHEGVVVLIALLHSSTRWRCGSELETVYRMNDYVIVSESRRKLVDLCRNAQNLLMKGFIVLFAAVLTTLSGF